MVVAEAIGVSRTHLSNMERGRDNPGRETLVALAAYYDVSLDWLTTGEGEIAPASAKAANSEEALLLYAYRELPEDEAASILKLLLGRIRNRSN